MYALKQNGVAHPQHLTYLEAQYVVRLSTCAQFPKERVEFLTVPSRYVT